MSFRHNRGNVLVIAIALAVVVISWLTFYWQIKGPLEARQGTAPAVADLPTITPRLTVTPAVAPQELAKRGEDLLSQGKLSEAVKLLTGAVNVSPDDPRANALLGKALIRWSRWGSPAPAVARLQHAVDLQPQNAEYQALLCLALDWNNEFDKALKACQRSTDIAPTYAPAHAYFAETYADSNQADKAVMAAKKAVELDGKSAEGHRGLAYVRQMVGDFETAEGEYGKSIDLQPADSFFRLSLVDYFLGRQRWNEAETELKRVIESDPGNPQGQEGRGLVFYKQKKYADAIPYFKKAVELDPQRGKANSYLGWSYYLQENYETALPYFQQAAKLDPQRADAHNDLGWTLYYLGHFAEARDAFQKALQISPRLKSAQDGLDSLAGRN